MKLLEAEPTAAPVAPPEPPQEGHQDQAAPPSGARTCRACGAAMAPEQDWCLSCGTAAPGRLGSRPGWRAATTVIGITAALVIGAVAAGYAALNGDASREAAAPPPPSAAPIAQAPPAATTPAATTPAATTPAPATPAAPAKGGTLPKVKVPASPSSPGSVRAKPVVPSKHTSPPSTGTGTTPSSTTPSHATHPSTGTATPPATPKPAGPTPISLRSDAGSIYDPYQRAAEAGDASKALDGDPSTAWFVTAKSPDQMAVGYVVDLGKLRGVRELKLSTSTPGFRIEVYATDEASLPPDILDTRWSHITNRSDVDSAAAADARDGNTAGDGKERIVLGSGSSKYRHVLLWFTQPPKDGARIEISELQLLH